MHRLVGPALALVFSSFVTGCVVENDPPRNLRGSEDPGAVGGYGDDDLGGGDGTGTTGGTASSPAPMLAVIDTDQTMTADPGQGVGVFIEYGTGGKWHLWWTCDTLQTNQDCDFSVSATAAQGNITDLDATELPGGYVASPTASRVEAHVTTSTEVHGIRFATEPGAVVTVEASIGGLEDGSFLFFVQDGKVNGGFSGRLTNPLQVQGDTP
jgi:hypothetical protein